MVLTAYRKVQDFLFIGSCEVEKYGEINSEFLTSLGKVVFRQGETMIIEVFDGEIYNEEEVI